MTDDELLRLRRDLAAIAHAVGVCYEADGHGCHPGPTETIVEAIRELYAQRDRLQNQLWERHQDAPSDGMCRRCGGALAEFGGDETFRPRRGCAKCNLWHEKPKLRRP